MQAAAMGGPSEQQYSAMRADTLEDEVSRLETNAKPPGASSRSSAASASNGKYKDFDDGPEGDADEDIAANDTADAPLLRSASHIFRRRPEEIRQMAQAKRIKTTEELWKRGIVVAALIMSWYFFSMLISVYNKWMFDPKKRNLPFPVFVTSIHMVVQFSIASALLAIFDATGKIKIIPRRHDGQRRRPSSRDWMTKVFPCALASALDIGLSNTSLKSITLTLYTMCKSSNLVFVLLFAFLFGLEKLKWNLIAVIVVITAGVVMMVSAETELVVIGAVQVLLASCMGGLRWALTQMLLEKEKLGMNNPVATIFWLCPPMAVLLLATSGIVEDWRALFGGEEFHGGLWRLIKTLAMILFPGCLAFCMSLSEFALIQRTSVVTLSVAGILKEILTVIVASVVFDDRLTPVNITGLCIAIAGIAAYNWIKYRSLKLQQELQEESRAAASAAASRATSFEVRRGGTGTALAGEGSGDPHHGIGDASDSEDEEDQILFSAGREASFTDTKAHPLATAKDSAAAS
ncbi:unnamed protein product [Parajaminaea phylloscopi]